MASFLAVLNTGMNRQHHLHQEIIVAYCYFYYFKPNTYRGCNLKCINQSSGVKNQAVVAHLRAFKI